MTPQKEGMVGVCIEGPTVIEANKEELGPLGEMELWDPWDL